MELDRVPLWRGDHVSIKQIVEDFARYLYLPRVSDSTILLKSISDGVGLLTWEHDAFALADSYDGEAKRYRGLRGGKAVSLPDADAPGLLVKPDVARTQLDAERPKPTLGSVGPDVPGTGGEGTGSGGGSGTGEGPPAPPKPRSLCASTALSPLIRRVWGAMRDASRTRSSRTCPVWLEPRSQ